MQIGVRIRNIGGYGEGAGVAACLDVARRAEALGFDSLWVGDHIVAPVNGSGAGADGRFPSAWDEEVYDPLVLLSALAQVTRRATLGSAVLVAPYRHPLVAAKLLSTADRLSGGRIVCGIGTGWLEPEFRALGLSPEQFRERGAVTDDDIRALKEAWLNTGPSRYIGEYVQFRDVGTFPHPVQTPHIPLWAGGNGQRSLRRAARLCQGWIARGLDPHALGEGVAELRRLAERDRRDPEEISVAVSLRLTLRDGAEAGAGPLDGTAKQIVAALERYHAAGLQHLIADVRGADPSLAATLAALEAVAATVLPAVHGYEG
ncbi:MAG TPA: TIGR03619 family F420-dependent LLM class oxidoreductase [Dehalococcoidia bacterium]|nr:TIGR03619 family F420-dependent LLM class oxidoreductase [Dehalococcoidia bacterium]